MQTFLTLQRQGRQRPAPVHFSQVIGRIGETLESCDNLCSPAYALSDEFACSYLRRNLQRKALNLVGLVSDPVQRRKDTIQGFLTRELVNRRINAERTWGYDSRTNEHTSDLLGDNLLFRARDIIRDIVGDAPDLERIVKGSSFGNGASCTMARAEADGTQKWIHGLSVTTGLSDFMTKVIETSPAWAELTDSDPVWTVRPDGTFCYSESNLHKVAGGVLDTVDKTAAVDRIIIKGAELNGFIQKGIGSELRSLLRVPLRHTDGIDLNRSGSVNARLAREGSALGHIATVDGERASDSQALALYELLWPPAWYKLFCAAREPYALIDGRYWRLEMMAGMGCGFTFEAQSVIFYAIGLACAERSNQIYAERLVSIHGDDLIVPSDAWGDVCAAYESAGIVINAEKSFHGNNPFRESCGGHFYLGDSVKPFYVKQQDGRSRGDWFWLANSLLLWLNDRGDAFLSSKIGFELSEILRYLNWYASSGKPKDWKVPVDFSRRAGLFSDAPKLVGGSWKTRMVGEIALKININRHGRYLQWLNKPKIVTVYDLIFGQKPSDDDCYTTITETMEVDRYKRLIAWNGFAECGTRTPLWFWSHLRSRKDS